jgi:hypothetical protein
VRWRREHDLAVRVPRMTEHARTTWPQLTNLHIRHRGAFAYVEGELADGEAVKLMRLRYGGTASRWGFALYYASSDRRLTRVSVTRRLWPPPSGRRRDEPRARRAGR